MEDRPNNVETLRLVTAFFNITDPEARRSVLAIVEATASGNAVTVDALRSLMNERSQG